MTRSGSWLCLMYCGLMMHSGGMMFLEPGWLGLGLWRMPLRMLIVLRAALSPFEALYWAW